MVASQPYFDALLLTDSKNAIAQTKEIYKIAQDEDTWLSYLKLAEQIDEAITLLAEKKGKEALEAISNIHLDKLLEFNKVLVSMRASAYSLQGLNDTAYHDLIGTFLDQPSVEINQLIYDYGKKLSKDAKTIKSDIWVSIDSTATPATTFSLKNSITSHTVSLADYLGKVVLITYWYPGCGPCREEYPHFENVIKKINGKELAYLALNIVPPQNAYVAPFLKKTGYSFISLDDPHSMKRQKGNLDNKGFAPANFLIDKKGRLVFSDFRTTEETEDDLEMMIKVLLDD